MGGGITPEERAEARAWLDEQLSQPHEDHILVFTGLDWDGMGQPAPAGRSSDASKDAHLPRKVKRHPRARK